MTKRNTNSDEYSHPLSSEEIEKYLDRAFGKHDEDYAEEIQDEIQDDRYYCSFPCSAEQADKMMRKYEERKQKLIKILNDDWEEFNDIHTRQDAVRYIIWSACFYIGNDPEKMLKIFRDLDPSGRDNRTELYDQWSGNHEDVKMILEYKYQNMDEFYAHGESDDD